MPLAVVRNYDPLQKRDSDGKWGDGAPGAPGDFFDLAGLTGVVEIEGTFGDLAMGVDPTGDVRLDFREYSGSQSHIRELDLGSDELAELGNALDELAIERDQLADDLGPSEVHDDRWFGGRQEHKAELQGNGMIVVTFGAEDPDPWTLRLDPPYEADPADPSDEDYDDVQLLIDAIDEVLSKTDAGRSRNGGRAVSELRALIERKFNPSQPRESGGEHGGQWTSGSAGALKDTLKLAGKIDLAPDEKLVGSAKIDGDGGIRMALTEQAGRRTLRLGLGGEGYGQRNRDTGSPAWDGNPGREPLSKEEYDRLDAEHDALDAEYDSASPARQDELQARMEAIREQLSAGDGDWHGTAKLDEYSMKRLADRIRPALAEALDQLKAENAAWDEIEALEAKGNPDPDRLAELRQVARAVPGSPGYGGVVFVEGIVPGSEWGDVHYSVELDDPTTGVYVRFGVQPKDAPDDWGDGKDWQGQFDAGETRKFLRLLDQYAKAPPMTQRAYSQEQGGAKAAPAGGQFALGGGRVGAQAKKQPQSRRKGPAKTAGPKRAAAPAGPLSFDGKHGTGYGIKGGDPRVRTLQAALKRLGLTDSSGAALVLDGKYGPRTTSSVKKLQRALGLPADGKVTPELLKQATELKQLPPKTTKPRKPPAKKAVQPASRRSMILAQVARALGECRLVDGVCIACEPQLDEASRALMEAFDEIERVRHVRTAAGVAKYGLPIGSVIGGGSGPHVPNAPHVPTVRTPTAPEAARPAVPERMPAGRTTLKDRLVGAIDDHLKGGGDGDPLADFSRPQLVKVAKERGVALDRGEHRDSIAKKLLDHARGDSQPESKPEPAPVARPVRDASKFTDADKLDAAVKMYGSDESKWPKRVQTDAARIRARQAKAAPKKPEPTPTPKPAESSRGGAYNGPMFEFSTPAKAKLADEMVQLKVLDFKNQLPYGTPGRRRLEQLEERSGFTEAELRHIGQQASIQREFDRWAAENPTGMAEAKLKADMERRSREAWAGKPVAMRVTPKALTGILAEGRIKSQFETGTSKGLLDKKLRANAEAKWFGLDANSDPKKRPIYGYVAVEGVRPALVDGDEDRLSQYGRIQVVLKDEVRDRTTAQWGDSLDQAHLGIPEPVNAPTWRSYSLATSGIGNVGLKSLDRDVNGQEWRQWNYVEAQIHGGVSTDDIAEVVLPSGSPASLRKALDAAGVPWRVL